MQAGPDRGDPKYSPQAGIESLPPDEQARQRKQEPLLRLNDRVYDLTSEVYEEHFDGSRPDVEHETLVVYWAGSVPKALTELGSQVATSGTHLDFKPAPFSRKQLMAAADYVLPSGELEGRVELAVDGSGLTVAVGDLPSVIQGGGRDAF